VWSASTLNGNASRNHGILVNPIYAGTIVWNRVRMIKDPDSGKRVSRNNPPSEWMRVAASHLAIVDVDIFQLAQERKQVRSHAHPGMRRAPKHLFSGLLKCNCCGGGMSIKDRDHGRTRIICTRSKESGTCNNRRAFYMDQIERRIATGLRSRLGSSEAITEFSRPIMIIAKSWLKPTWMSATRLLLASHPSTGILTVRRRC
jgi:site-specific DNA recombinase